MNQSDSVLTAAVRPLVLVVDDSSANLLMFEDLLAPDYRVRLAKSGAQALSAAQLDPQPDLILLDVMMPDMDGYEVIQRLRALPATADIPVSTCLRQRRARTRPTGSNSAPPTTFRCRSIRRSCSPAYGRTSR